MKNKSEQYLQTAINICGGVGAVAAMLDCDKRVVTKWEIVPKRWVYDLAYWAGEGKPHKYVKWLKRLRPDMFSSFKYNILKLDKFRWE